MAETKAKQDVRMIFKIGAFLAFIMLGYLGLRSYKKSVEKLKINECSNQIIELVRNINEAYRNDRDYGEFDYKTAAKLKLFPKNMMKEGFNEAVNGYFGGVDVYYSSSAPEMPKGALEVSFQGVSKMGCMSLMRINLTDLNLIAVGGYSGPTPAGVLDEIYAEMKQEDIKKANIYVGKTVMYVADDKVEKNCACKDDVCSVVWKFRKM